MKIFDKICKGINIGFAIASPLVLAWLGFNAGWILARQSIEEMHDE